MTDKEVQVAVAHFTVLAMTQERMVEEIYKLQSERDCLREALTEIQGWVKRSVDLRAELVERLRPKGESRGWTDATAELHAVVNMGMNIRSWCKWALDGEWRKYYPEGVTK